MGGRGSDGGGLTGAFNLLLHLDGRFELLRSPGSAWNFRLRLGRKKSKKPPQPDRSFLVNRAGVGLLLSDTELGEHLKQLGRLYLEFPRQFVDSDLTHKD
jgi:hypothetical protein